MPFPLVPIIAGLVAAGGAVAGSAITARNNRKIAEFQAEANERYLRQQLEYDKPINQMARFQEAGLNPNLIYSQGSAGNQSTPLRYPDFQGMNLESLGQLMNTVNQTAMTRSQVQATDARTQQTYVMTELNRMQQKLIEANPLLNDEGFKAILDSLKATAAMKREQSDWFTGKDWFQSGDFEMTYQSRGYAKMDAELNRLVQQFDLGTQDQQIKAQILKSQEFRNALSEIEMKFMRDGDIQEGHLLQFIKLLILKSF